MKRSRLELWFVPAGIAAAVVVLVFVERNRSTALRGGATNYQAQQMVQNAPSPGGGVLTQQQQGTLSQGRMLWARAR